MRLDGKGVFCVWRVNHRVGIKKDISNLEHLGLLKPTICQML